MMKNILVFMLMAVFVHGTASAQKFEINNGEAVAVCIDTTAASVVASSFLMLKEDMHAVLNAELVRSSSENAMIVCHTNVKGLDAEGFRLHVNTDGNLLIESADTHGLAYALMELSRRIGVSPWEWWADCKPRPKKHFTLPAGFDEKQSPKVRFRGIFINDEDWGLAPWADRQARTQANYSAINGRKVIPPSVNERIFQLLLRLRANTYWPAMHEVTQPFFLTDGNREMAARYGIYIGSSHCEPLACNAAGEWNVRGKGDYDFVHNRSNVVNFWKDRVRNVAKQEILYTVGIRGVHDGKMQGANTIAEQKTALTQVIAEQRNLLSRYVCNDVTQVPQLFIPYKEVLDVYNDGLEVPEDVTLVWCDDNYGYIRHFPTHEESNRKGGNGLYYHVSYWGRPHDYLWLSSTSPRLIDQQMNEAYSRGIRRFWILNVGDIKPAEILIEHFLTKAWSGAEAEVFLPEMMTREFGNKIGRRVAGLLEEYYSLAWQRRPEFLGGTRTEESDRSYWNAIRPLPLSPKQMKERVKRYSKLSKEVERLWKQIPENRRDAFFQLVKYPIQAAAQMNLKYLCPDMAQQAHDSIAALTLLYNKGFANDGKFDGLMDMNPRRLPVFQPLNETAKEAIRSYLANDQNEPVCVWSAGKKDLFRALMKGETLECEFSDYKAIATDSLTFEVVLVPTHPVDGKNLRFALSIDGGEPVVVDYATKGRSEEWKENVLRNAARREVALSLLANKKGKHRVVLTAMDDCVLVQQINIKER